MKLAGFTIVESLIVLSIIVIVSVVVQPALSSAKHASQVQASVSRLKQLHLGVHLYRTDYDLTGYSVSEFPPRSFVYSSYFGFGEQFFKSPCGYKEGIESNRKGLSYQYVPNPDPTAELHLSTYQENALLFRDPHCNTVVQWNSTYMTKRKLGVLVSGQILNEMGVGSTTRIDWWLPRAMNKNP